LCPCIHADQKRDSACAVMLLTKSKAVATKHKKLIRRIWPSLKEDLCH